MTLTASQVTTRYVKLKHTEKDITSPCDLLYWFVDVLGNPDTMKSLLNHRGVIEFVKSNDHLREFASTNSKNGVVFVGDENAHGHFHSMIENDIRDSYELGYQPRGSHNFCQLFSIMIYLRTKYPQEYDFDLLEGAYAHNITVAMTFLKRFLKNPRNRTMRNMLLDRIHDFTSRDYPEDQTWIYLVNKPIPLYDMTISHLYEFIDNVSTHAHLFTSC